MISQPKFANFLRPLCAIFFLLTDQSQIPNKRDGGGRSQCIRLGYQQDNFIFCISFAIFGRNMQVTYLKVPFLNRQEYLDMKNVLICLCSIGIAVLRTILMNHVGRVILCQSVSKGVKPKK